MMRGMHHAGPETTRIAAPAAAAPNGWPPAVLAGVERELARFIGPLAATLVRRAAQKHNTIDALIAALLPSIEGQQDRDAFARTCGRRAVMHPASAAPTLSRSPAASAPQQAPTAPVPGHASAARLPLAAPPLPARAPAPAPAVAPMPARVASPAPAPAHAGSALLRAADSLLGAVTHLRNLGTLPDPAALRTQLLLRVAAFEADAAAAGVSPSHIAAAKTLLCSFADEAIAASPWGAQGLWAAHALAATPLPDPLQIAEQVLADPQAQAPLIELFHVALALGYEGRWGDTPQGKAQLDHLAARLQALLPSRRGRTGAARTLSLHWRGLATRGPRDLATLPLWAAVALGGALLLALWLVLNARLDARTRPVFARIAAMPAALQGPTSAVATRPRLAAVLPADAQIEVRDEAQRSLITLPADGLFVADSARLDAHADAILARVAQALRGAQAQGGEVVVIGHGDDAAPASLQFPTGWHLTRARAQTVADALVARRVAPVRAEGRAEFEPRAANTTPAGRAQNRRIEIELRLRRPEEVQ
jgi:type VI secretion system protein ImpK